MSHAANIKAQDESKFLESYDVYANRFNALAEKLEQAGIDVDELSEVINAAADFERLRLQYTNKYANMAIINSKEELDAVILLMLQRIER